VAKWTPGTATQAAVAVTIQDLTIPTPWRRAVSQSDGGEGGWEWAIFVANQATLTVATFVDQQRCDRGPGVERVRQRRRWGMGGDGGVSHGGGGGLGVGAAGGKAAPRVKPVSRRARVPAALAAAVWPEANGGGGGGPPGGAGGAWGRDRLTGRRAALAA
jgi:hypothetical protein